MGLGGTDAVATIKVSPTTENFYSVLLAADDIGCKPSIPSPSKSMICQRCCLGTRHHLSGWYGGFARSWCWTPIIGMTNAGTGAQVIDRPTASLVYSVVGTKTACWLSSPFVPPTGDGGYAVLRCVGWRQGHGDGASTTIKASEPINIWEWWQPIG